MATRLDDISEAIGALRSEVGALHRGLEKSERTAQEHRKGVHRRMDDLVGEVSDVKETVAAATGSIETLKGEVTKIKGVTDDVERMRQRAIGAPARWANGCGVPAIFSWGPLAASRE